MNISQIEDFADKALQLVQKAAPLAGALFGPTGAAIGSMAANVAGTLDVVLKDAEADAEIIASGDVGRIKALQSKLQIENDALAAQVAAS